MSFNNSFTAVTGATYTAAQYNTHTRDNLTAIWVYTTAGDIAYATSATALARLGIGANTTTVLMPAAGVPTWSHSPAIQGVLHAKGTVDFAPGGQSFSSTWADITGATLDLVLTQTCTVFVMAVVGGYNGTTGRSFNIRANVNGSADSAPTLQFNGGAARNEALPYNFYVAGVTAGTRTVKLQCQADTQPNVVERGRLQALAFVE